MATVDHYRLAANPALHSDEDSDGVHTPIVSIQGDVTVDVGEIQIGAVELKDGETENRAAIDASGRLSVDGSAVTQPVSAVALPLPGGASTAENQAQVISTLGDIADNTTGIATSARQDTSNTALAAIQAKVEGTIAVTQSGAWSITFGSPQHVIIDSSASIAVTGPLTDAQLRASSVDVAASALEVAQGAVSTDLVGPMVQGIVNDAPTSPLNDVTAPLSLTKQGRLRVATVIEDLGVSFTSADEAAMWGNLKTDFTFTGSPWSGW